MVQLDRDGELGFLSEIYGAMEAEFEAQRTIKRTELTTFLFLQKKMMGLVKVHVDSKGIIDALWRGERKCVDPKAGDADLRIKMLEELHLFMSKEILMEVEHVKTA